MGSLYLLGDENRVFLGAESPPSSGPEKIVGAFTEILLADVTKLKKTHLTVVYTSVDDPNYWKKIPYVFGWSGHRFIGYRDPEHAIDPSEFE